MSSGCDTESVAEQLEAHFHNRNRPGVVSVYLFGSHARNSAHKESDIDVGVILSRDIHPSSSDRFAELAVR